MKPLFAISSPFDTYSGYGARARDVIKAIIETDKYNVKLLSQRWGNLPFGFCEDNPEWEFLLDYLTPNNQLIQQPDIWAQITVPNEFQAIGKYNIGFTAGMETTLVHGSWVEGVNRMDVTFVSSEHSKKSFLNSVFEKGDNQGNKLGEVRVEKPIEVLFEGVNLKTYFEDNKPCLVDFNIKESFAYLFVGHWMQGKIGEDRKNVGLLVKAFLETFKNKKKTPALILKTSQSGASYMDRDEILRKIQTIKDSVNSKNLPNIYLLHGEFSNEEMNSIYNHSKVKAMVSLTKGEGFGRPLLEFTQSKKPLIVSGWSGHMDFLNPEHSVCIRGNLTNVDPSAAVKDMILTESQWFSPNHAEVGHALKDVFENYKNYVDKGKRQAYHCKTNFSWDQMKTQLESRLDELIPEFPKQIELKLPKLNLPKLNKSTSLDNSPQIEHFYDKVDGWFTFPQLYKSMVEKFDDAHFVEVGTWKGRSAAYMAVEIANSNKNIKFDCVDNWEYSDIQTDIVEEKYNNLYETFLDNIKPVKQYVNPIKKLSLDAAKDYKDSSLDFVFIDAAHDYDNVKADIEAWLPKLKKGGIIAGHDYADYAPGLIKAVNEIFGDVKSQEQCWIKQL